MFHVKHKVNYQIIIAMFHVKHSNNFKSNLSTGIKKDTHTK